VEILCRPYTVDDAPALHEAILASLEHLRPWMPWVALEPLTLEQRTAWIADGGDAVGIFHGEIVVGGTGLHDRLGDPAGREIGYWVRDGWTARGIATAAARQMVDLAFSMDGVTYVEIHHDKANAASRRVPEKLGFTLIRERKDEISAPGEIGISCDWRLDRRT
jgi:ribosomal-protein-serine acetyltransferase